MNLGIITKPLLSVLMIVGVAVACTTPPPGSPTVLVYGDSLTVQSIGATHAAYDAVQTTDFQAKGGTAACDWAPGVMVDRAAYKPTRVVIAFTGNASTPCANAAYVAGGIPAVVANYEQAIRQFRAVYLDIPITIIGTPAMAPTVPGYPVNGNSALNTMYQRVAAELGMTYSSAADDGLTPGHVFTMTRPTYGGGPVVTVRLTDGIHLTTDGATYYGHALGG